MHRAARVFLFFRLHSSYPVMLLCSNKSAELSMPCPRTLMVGARPYLSGESKRNVEHLSRVNLRYFFISGLSRKLFVPLCSLNLFLQDKKRACGWQKHQTIYSHKNVPHIDVLVFWQSLPLVKSNSPAVGLHLLSRLLAEIFSKRCVWFEPICVLADKYAFSLGLPIVGIMKEAPYRSLSAKWYPSHMSRLWGGHGHGSLILYISSVDGWRNQNRL